jgi:hypothetical protein
VLAASIIRAASTSETSVNFYQTTRRYNPEDEKGKIQHTKWLLSEKHSLDNLHTRRRENLKSYPRFISYLQQKCLTHETTQ